MNSTDSKEDDEDIRLEGQETLGKEYQDEEGDNDNTDLEKAVYPDAKVNIFPESQSAFQLLRKFNKAPPLIKLDPDFQRHSVWSLKQKSELIESIIMGIPLPIIYVKEDDVGAYIIVDGRQRLTTLFEFMEHKFCLKGLTVLEKLNGCYFSDNNGKLLKHFSSQEQSKIEDCQLALNVIKPPTPDRITFDLFDRVNRGGTRLNNQEMRNAIYSGKSTQLLKDLSGLDSFKEATEYAVKSNRMKDRYIIVRCLGFYLWKKNKLLDVKDSSLVEYRSSLEDFLRKTMLFLNSQQSSEFRETIIVDFDNTMKKCKELFGVGCFRLPKHADSKTRRPINMALFESISYLMLELLPFVDSKQQKIKETYKTLIRNNTEYIDSLTKIVDSNISVLSRFKEIDKVIKEIKNA